MSSVKWCFTVLALIVVMLGFVSPVWGAEFKGKIETVVLDNDKVIVVSPEGEVRTFHFDDATVVRLNEQKAQLKDLKKGDEIIIIHNEEDDLNYATEVRCVRR